MRFRILPLCLCAFATLLFVAGCGRYESSTFTAEIDEPNYRRGKDLVRQGRNPEALASFLKVIEKRGDDAPESHLEVGILYQQHIKDPLAAIYHYRKFREVKRNSPQADLVRQRIDAATREFARDLPAQPLQPQMDKLDLLDKLEQLQRENERLKEQLGIRSGPTGANSGRPGGSNAPANVASAEPLAPLAVDPMESPIAAAPEPAPVEIPVASAPLQPPTRPAVSNPVATPSQNQPPPPPPAVAGRRYVVAKGDTLFAIAKRHYGSASNARVQGILSANRAVLPNAAALQPGMTLIIPNP